MAAIEVTIRPSAKRFTAAMRAMSDVLAAPGRGPMLEGMRAAGDVYFDYARNRFLANSRGGGDWPPLADSTRKRLEPGHRMLIRTGRLLNALIPGAAGNVIRPLPNGVRCAVTVPYAVYHQHGTRRMPRRVVLPAPDGPTIRRMRAEIGQPILSSVIAAANAAVPTVPRL